MILPHKNGSRSAEIHPRLWRPETYGLAHQPLVLTEGHPVLYVKNVTMSLDYYCNKLGFQDVDHWSLDGTPPWTFAQARRENVCVHLHPWAQGPGMSMYLYLASLEDLAALYQESTKQRQ